MQRNFRHQYGAEPPTSKIIRHCLKCYKETSSILKAKPPGRASTSVDVAEQIRVPMFGALRSHWPQIVYN